MLLSLLISAAHADGAVLLQLSPGAEPPPGAAPLFRPAPRRDPAAFAALGLDRYWRLPVSGDPAEAAAKWQAQPGVVSANPDHIGHATATPSDTLFGWQWGLRNDGSFSSGAVSGADIQAEDAWDITVGSGDVVVAVLDSGFNDAEPDFSSRIWDNAAEATDGSDSDGNGYVDDVSGWDFAYSDAVPEEGTGHGSNVASIIAAEGDNALGYAGVCWDCQVMTLKVLNHQDWGYYSWWAEAVVYAVDNGASVINMSLGGTSSDTALCQSIQYATDAGVPVVVSMGNGDSSASYWPAACDAAISVGATDAADRRASPFCWGGGSSYGDHILVSAPGEAIYGLSRRSGVYDEYWCGTSQAAPHVSGLVALLLDVAPDLSVDEIIGYLIDGAEDEVGDPAEDTEGWDAYHGYGRINAYSSLSLLSAAVADDDKDGYSRRDGDCDDADPAAYPGAAESCDRTDSDCDGSLTDGFSDLDEDGEPDCIEDADGDGRAPADGDCDDTTAAVSPDAAEVPYDGVDNDCNSETLDDDLDGDGFGAETDCDDNNALINPSVDELCDSVDNDCDGETDEDAADGQTLYVDADGDGYGGAEPVVSCSSDGLAAASDDCDDTDPASTVAREWYPDFDGDGLGDGDHPLTSCTRPDSYVAAGGDCDDSREGERCGGCNAAGLGSGAALWLALPLLLLRRRP